MYFSRKLHNNIVSNKKNDIKINNNNSNFYNTAELSS